MGEIELFHNFINLLLFNRFLFFHIVKGGCHCFFHVHVFRSSSLFLCKYIHRWFIVYFKVDFLCTFCFWRCQLKLFFRFYALFFGLCPFPLFNPQFFGTGGTVFFHLAGKFFLFTDGFFLHAHIDMVRCSVCKEHKESHCQHCDGNFCRYSPEQCQHRQSQDTCGHTAGEGFCLADAVQFHQLFCNRIPRHTAGEENMYSVGQEDYKAESPEHLPLYRLSESCEIADIKQYRAHKIG